MPKTLSQIIAARVEKALEDAGFRSQDEFANVIGVPRATINRVLSGRFDNRLSTLEKISKGLGVSLGALLDGAQGKKGPGNAALHAIGPKKKSSILVKILVPKDEEIPKWLVDACREGAGQIEQEPAKRKPKTSGASRRRSVGLGEILETLER
jgi:transcriptional regulator with XRE-family HTH domain